MASSDEDVLLTSSESYVDAELHERERKLRDAAEIGDVGSIRSLTRRPFFRKVIRIDSRSAELGRTALMFAAEHGSLAAVRLLLKAKASVRARDRRGNTPLMRAMKTAPIETIHFLLESKSNVLAKNGMGFTPLMLALQNEHSVARACKLLIQNRADVFACDVSGKRALEWARLRRLPDMFQIFKNHELSTVRSRLGVLQVTFPEPIIELVLAYFFVWPTLRARSRRSLSINDAKWIAERKRRGRIRLDAALT